MNDPCPDDDTLTAFLAGRLPKERTSALRAHIARCAPCNAAATGVILSAAETFEARPHAPRGPAYVLERGSTVGVGARYRLEAPLGEGGMGVVWSAWDAAEQRPVAIKFLRGFDADARRRFALEIAVSKSLTHPGLVRVLDVLPEVEADAPALVMEKLEGASLAQRLVGRRGLSVVDCRTILRSVAETLDFVHRNRAVHRDLKPANVFLVRSTSSASDVGGGGPPELGGVGDVKVLDFGLAQLLSDSQLATFTRVTPTGHIVGTLLYMAPEQLGGQRADARADVWALGALIHEALIGAPPFLATTPAGLLACIRSTVRPLPTLARLASDADSAWLAVLIERMLSSAVEARPGSMKEILASIQ